MRRYELAVHLVERRASRAVKHHIKVSGGLVHRDSVAAWNAANKIARHYDVEWVNVSYATYKHIGIAT